MCEYLESARSSDIPIEEKLRLIDQHTDELDRRIDLVEALIDAVRREHQEGPYQQ